MGGERGIDGACKREIKGGRGGALALREIACERNWQGNTAEGAD